MKPHPLTPDLPPRWRLRNPASGREVIVAARPGVSYIDRITGEPLEVVAQVLPVSPAPSRLAWTVENLRLCPTCDQLVPKDLNHCPYDGRPLPPLAEPPRRTGGRGGR